MTQEIFIKRLKTILSEKNIKQSQLASMTGITASSISDWLKGKYFPKQDKIEKLSIALEVDKAWLLGEKKLRKSIATSTNETANINFTETNIIKVPLLGVICAGDGVYVEQDFEDFIHIDQSTNADFALKVDGDSMIDAGILDGDIVFIQKKSSVGNGKIAAVLLTETNEASLKKFYKKQDHVLLQPCNSYYEPIITKDVLVLGECVGVFRKL